MKFKKLRPLVADKHLGAENSPLSLSENLCADLFILNSSSDSEHENLLRSPRLRVAVGLGSKTNGPREYCLHQIDAFVEMYAHGAFISKS